jgi:F-box-like
MPLPFPVEIVEYILDFVGYPDLTPYLSPPYALYDDHDLPLHAIHLSARSLSSLALVSKQWNAICTPRLYRCLAISDSTAIDPLLHTLERSQTTAAIISGKILPLGYLTRHLIIALSDSPVDNETERFGTRILRRFGNLGRLARCLPHLHILSVSILTQDMWGLPPPHYGRDFAAAVTQTSAHSLLKLHLHREPFVLFSRRELRKLLESTPNLVAITGAGVGDCIGCPVALPYLPKLKYLAVNDVMGYCDRNEHKDNRIPFLDHIHIRQHLLSNYCVHLLSVQGARLTSVSLDLRLFEDPKNCSDHLSMLNNFCPNLSYLEICIDTWTSFPRLESLPPVERLGVRLHFNDTNVATICNILATIQSSSLKVVQLMNPGMFERFASDNESVWDPLVFHTFRVLDFDGRELGPPGQ